MLQRKLEKDEMCLIPKMSLCCTDGVRYGRTECGLYLIRVLREYGGRVKEQNVATIAYIRINQTWVRPFSSLFNLEHFTLRQIFHLILYFSELELCISQQRRKFFFLSRCFVYSINSNLIFWPISIFNDLKCIARIKSLIKFIVSRTPSSSMRTWMNHRFWIRINSLRHTHTHCIFIKGRWREKSALTLSTHQYKSSNLWHFRVARETREIFNLSLFIKWQASERYTLLANDFIMK